MEHFGRQPARDMDIVLINSMDALNMEMLAHKLAGTAPSELHLATPDFRHFNNLIRILVGMDDSTFEHIMHQVAINNRLRGLDFYNKTNRENSSD